jgi:hypothetical protein
MQAAPTAYIQESESLQVWLLEESQQTLLGDVASLGGKIRFDKRRPVLSKTISFRHQNHP